MGWKNTSGWGGGLMSAWPVCGGGLGLVNGNGAKWHGVVSCDESLHITELYVCSCEIVSN